jgi:hypothetical protein
MIYGLRCARTISPGGGTRCAFCSWQSAPYDAEYSITVGGVALVHYCSRRCALIDARVNRRGTLVIA